MEFAGKPAIEITRFSNTSTASGSVHPLMNNADAWQKRHHTVVENNAGGNDDLAQGVLYHPRPDNRNEASDSTSIINALREEVSELRSQQLVMSKQLSTLADLVAELLHKHGLSRPDEQEKPTPLHEAFTMEEGEMFGGPGN
jgi:hypothetical protein